MGDSNEFLFKTLVVGNPGIGKTSIIHRYVDNQFSQAYKFTIGVDFALKELEFNNHKVKLQLWDIAGQERFSQMLRVYYKEATACIIVFDITRQVTFESVVKWKEDLDKKVLLPNGNPVPCILLANKCDLPARPVSNEEITALSERLGFVGWYATSAKDNTNIDIAIKSLVQRIMEDGNYTTPSSAQRSGVVTVIDDKQAQVNKQEDSSCMSCMK